MNYKNILQMDEQIFNINNAEICTESFGRETDIPILLIMGASASMLWWDDEFCSRLAEQDRFVIRYDNRDTGRSTCYKPGSPGYNLTDMVDDARGVLDSYSIAKANIVGMSLGGMLAQVFALRYPENASTITMIASSVFGPDNPELPQAGPKIVNYYLGGNKLDWNDRDLVIQYIADGWRLLAGSRHPFNEKLVLRLANEEVERSKNLLSSFNHSRLKGGEEYFGRIHEINIPSLIIHGTEDPVIPYAHGVALRNEIPGSKLITLERCGHEINYFDYDHIVNQIVLHTQIN